jgi:hypothetical protein
MSLLIHPVPPNLTKTNIKRLGLDQQQRYSTEKGLGEIILIGPYGLKALNLCRAYNVPDIMLHCCSHCRWNVFLSSYAAHSLPKGLLSAVQHTFARNNNIYFFTVHNIYCCQTVSGSDMIVTAAKATDRHSGYFLYILQLAFLCTFFFV